jgi:hypothetical protein
VQKLCCFITSGFVIIYLYIMNAFIYIRITCVIQLRLLQQSRATTCLLPTRSFPGGTILSAIRVHLFKLCLNIPRAHALSCGGGIVYTEGRERARTSTNIITMISCATRSHNVRLSIGRCRFFWISCRTIRLVRRSWTPVGLERVFFVVCRHRSWRGSRRFFGCIKKKR